MFRSLRGRLIVLLVLLTAGGIAAGALMIGLFRQSATAQAGQAAAEIGRACDAIAATYRFYSAGWSGPASGAANDTIRRDLTPAILTASHGRGLPSGPEIVESYGQGYPQVLRRAVAPRRGLSL